MNDINTINRLNAEAVQAAIPQHTAKGKHVVAEYHGLHFVGFSTHSSEEEALEKVAEIQSGDNPSAHGVIHFPQPTAPVQE